MNIEQLDALGQEVARFAQDKMGLAQLRFRAGRDGLDHRPWATGVMVKGSAVHGYAIAPDVLERLLSSSEPEVRRLLQAHLEQLAQQRIGVPLTPAAL
jgi:hypothetical protein